MCIRGLICDICFVIFCFSYLLVLVPRDGCAPGYLHIYFDMSSMKFHQLILELVDYIVTSRSQRDEKL